MAAAAAPTEPDQSALIEAGRLLFAGPCTFLLSVAAPKQLPEAGLPEVAFAGRSNVGKSSLINALTGRQTLARTSKTPGRTQQLNFFDLGGRLMLVDLPGYGYAEAPKALVERWTALLTRYLRGRSELQRVCLLLDARHGPKPADLKMMEMLDTAAVSYLAVLTKADKVKPKALQALTATLQDTLRTHPAALPAPLTTSAFTGDGVAALRAHLAALADPVN